MKPHGSLCLEATIITTDVFSPLREDTLGLEGA